MVCSLFFWFLFGWLADYSFPFGQALELLLACFKGTVSARINSLQQQLQRTDIVSQPDNQQQIQKLNNLESQAWLYEGILERLAEDPFANHEKIARTLEALEYKRSEILQELMPRRPRKYRILAGIQDSARSLLASQAEKDYERLEIIVTNLVFFARSRQPSQLILSEVIETLAFEIGRNANRISPYRLRLAYKIDNLIRILSAKLVLGDSFITDNSYQNIINELRSQINLLSEQFKNLLINEQKDKNELNQSIKEISNLTKKISDLYKTIYNLDADLSVLRKTNKNITELAKKKQSQIDNLETIIYRLQKDIETSSETDQLKQSQINQLENKLAQLNQQKLDLQKIIKDIADSDHIKESEIEKLQIEKSQLSSQKSELQRRYQVLYQQYKQQENEIINLKEQIQNISRINRSQSSIYNYKTPQQPINETREKITLEEYEKIYNKGDYIPVKAHYRNGSYVKAHYRRRPNR